METALGLFFSTMLTVFFLGLQSLNVNRGHYVAAFLTSFGIGAGNLVMLKLGPSASGIEVVAFLSGGPIGIVSAMWSHKHLVRWLSKK